MGKTLVSAVLAAAAIVSAPVLAAEAVTAQVTYVTASSVYVSAGSDDGLEVGQRLTVRRGAEVVATIEVTELSTHRASCRIVDRLLEPAVGDSVPFEPAAVVPDAVAVTEEVVPARARTPRGSGVHGRVGLRYLSVTDRTDELEDYSQPALDLRLDGRALGGSAWGFAVDARARRTQYSSTADEDDTRTRVYRAAVSRQAAGEPWTLTAGRQYAPALAAVSIFDGLSAEYGRERYAVGMIAGTQPDPDEYGYASDVSEYGAYAVFRGSGPSYGRYSLTTGLIGSYQDSDVNREFLYVQGSLVGQRFTAYLTQDVDYNRGWKSDQGEDTVAPTSTFASLSWRAASKITLHAGYDNRRNVRLYRDRETPETEFDDSFRRGVRAGASFGVGSHLRFGLDGFSSSREEGGDARTYTATAGAQSLAGGHLDVHGRATRYDNDRVEGWLLSAELGAPLGSSTYLRAQGGARQEDDLVGLSEGEDQYWLGLDAEFDLGLRWWLTLSAERTSGDRDEVDLLYTTLTYRF